jgi:hypothetical protein
MGAVQAATSDIALAWLVIAPPVHLHPVARVLLTAGARRRSGTYGKGKAEWGVEAPVEAPNRSECCRGTRVSVAPARPQRRAR